MEKIAAIHLKSFPNFFLSSLGFRFLKVFYSAILQNSNGISVAVTVNGEIAGFVVGSKIQSGFYKKLVKQYYIKFICAAFIPLVLSPGKILKIFSSLSSSNEMDRNLYDAACLLSICVDPKYNSLGLGSGLIQKFETELADRHIFYYYLTTDYYNNEKVNSFYLKNSFNLFSRFRQGKKRKMNIYTKNLKA